MKCPNCQYENRDDAKFCKSCGFKLAGLNDRPAPEPKPADAAPVCPACGAAIKPGTKFCSKCGTPLTMAAPEVKKEEAAAAHCLSCGTPLKPGAKFCSKCGASIAAPVPVSEPTPAPEPVPVPEPVPASEPVPVPEPVPAPAPIPIPEPIPAPAPVPVPEPIPVPEPTPAPAPVPAPKPVPVTEYVPKPEPAPAPEPTSGTFCRHCGTPLKPGAKFCSKCGTTVTISTPPEFRPESLNQNTDSAANNTRPEKPVKKEKKKDKEKKKSPVGIIILILIILLALGGGLFALDKAGIIHLFSKDSSEETEEDEENPENEETEEGTVAEEENAEDEDLTELEEKLTPLSEQVTAAEDKLNNEDYVGAASDLTDVLTTYADLASEYDSQSAADMISPLADNAFSLYTTATLKVVEGLENQSALAAIYQQIGITLGEASDLAAKLRESNLTISTDALDANYESYPARYKEKYILTFNDLRTGEEWSRTTAWQYMQDAASVGLVNKEDPDDPLTLRYAYALAWITQRDISEGMKDGSVTTQSAISSILSLAENMDYNPVLMRDLAIYYNDIGDSSSSTKIQNACADVYTYLSDKENVYLNGKELFVPGRSNSNASSTIALNDFWYFNDFGEYAPSTTNGVSPEGREKIRGLFRDAINSL